MTPRATKPDVARVLGGLKDFQRQTVEYIFRRMYLDDPPTHRFLLADEVGLGKTLVAKGVVARAIEHLWETIDRIDVVYICSNQDIARQNVARLNVMEDDSFAEPTRASLLPLTLRNLKQRKLNLIALTPGTSFELRTNLGRSDERVLLYYLLRKHWNLGWRAGPLNLLRGTAGRDSFRQSVRDFDPKAIDEGLADDFHRALDRRLKAERTRGEKDLRTRFEELCRVFGYDRKHIPREEHQSRSRVVGELRAELAAACLEALEPDLIIMDEFQRFKNLLRDDDETAVLARCLFEYPEARILLLSATPYKMYTLNHETEKEDHYQDFLETLAFLERNQKQPQSAEGLLRRFREELFSFGPSRHDQLTATKRQIEERLRRVMVRTERLAATSDRDGMLREESGGRLTLDDGDLESYIAFQKVAHKLDAGEVLEYWKSAPYLLNFMEKYDLKRAVQEVAAGLPKRAAVASILASAPEALMYWPAILRYEPVLLRNARLRMLAEETVGRGLWRLLWIPPSLPYYRTDRTAAQQEAAPPTKQLVFSSWHMVPKVVASLLSYEAERRLMGLLGEDKPRNTPEARKRHRPLLRFAFSEGRPTGMPVLAMIYPSVTLARLGDPLRIAAEIGGVDGDRPQYGDVLTDIRRSIEPLVDRLTSGAPRSGSEDDAWYWAAPLLLDRSNAPPYARDYLNRGGLEAAGAGGGTDDDGDATNWAKHLDVARDAVGSPSDLGRPPEDLVDVLSLIAIAGPGNVALRALSRDGGGEPALANVETRNAAASVAWAVRNLFNLPEAMALIRGTARDDAYWRLVLGYCAEGHLQAVLDEYAHVLRESLGLSGRPVPDTALQVAAGMRSAIGLRTSRVGVDNVVVDTANGAIGIEDRNLRIRFALRFGEDRTEDGAGPVRATQVRDAFNSPFWPFVLATTAVGQEGLDFHLYCHSVVHWNLPSNPVDLEQREGRVHRYKGHAVRINVARKYGLQPLVAGETDVWKTLFDRAVADRKPDTNDLVPFWVYPVPGGACIERHVPAFPLSREIERLADLRRSLAVYRMVFGQPRQEDLVAYLLTNFPKEQLSDLTAALKVDLSPPTTI